MFWDAYQCAWSRSVVKRSTIPRKYTDFRIEDIHMCGGTKRLRADRMSSTWNVFTHYTMIRTLGTECSRLTCPQEQHVHRVDRLSNVRCHLVEILIVVLCRNRFRREAGIQGMSERLGQDGAGSILAAVGLSVRMIASNTGRRNECVAFRDWT